MIDIRIPILVYHQVDLPPTRKTPFRGLTVAPQNFRRQMRALKRCGFQGLSLRELLPYLQGEMSGKVVGITFDDGYRNVFTHALPILDEAGFTATNFFVSGQIGGHNEWDEAAGIPYAPCMTQAQVREWAARGHEVGAHTLDHVRLTQVSLEQARAQILRSRVELEDLVGEAVTSFSYPWGDVSDAVRGMVQEAGYLAATTTRPAKASSQDDPLLLPRKYIEQQHGWVATILKCVSG